MFGEKFLGLSNGLGPVCRGECGRGKVGEVLETIRLFLLLLRQLWTETET